MSICEPASMSETWHADMHIAESKWQYDPTTFWCVLFTFWCISKFRCRNLLLRVIHADWYQNPHTFFFKTVIFISSAYLCFICRQHPHPRSPIPEVRYACLEMALLFHVDISCTSFALFFWGGGGCELMNFFTIQSARLGSPWLHKGRSSMELL